MPRARAEVIELNRALDAMLAATRTPEPPARLAKSIAATLVPTGLPPSKQLGGKSLLAPLGSPSSPQPEVLMLHGDDHGAMSGGGGGSLDAASSGGGGSFGGTGLVDGGPRDEGRLALERQSVAGLALPVADLAFDLVLGDLLHQVECNGM